ncbi:hypothetical protein [Natrialba asiatica]|uniref:Uncharacterized protein n=1 Tax=Natrialba asiatica (strain ATCC 700177 / DSM 12278 / JCM 9576 / FERM P-10747 / NBRC 102637 / 172P1) TaxID=29540 RepID=M0B6X9_NATA1|nr:hypothetical protein [Natrialba asiatica]ELZ05998.1 hypothetical protein C481_00650 [Natrialba asiatica DSM 12278]
MSSIGAAREGLTRRAYGIDDETVATGGNPADCIGGTGSEKVGSSDFGAVTDGTELFDRRRASASSNGEF